MKKLEIINLVSQGFNKISEQLSVIVEGLNNIKSIIELKENKISDINDEFISDETSKNINPNEKINRKQVANMLGISVKTLDRYRKKGIIPFSQVDEGKVTFKYKDVLAFQYKVKKINCHRKYPSDFSSDSNN